MRGCGSPRVPPVTHEWAEIAIGQPALWVELTEHVGYARKRIFKHEAMYHGGCVR